MRPPRAVVLALVFALALPVAVVLLGDRTAPLCPGCNVVVISLDTLRADRTGVYTAGLPTTPALERMASGSVVFERAISQSAWTRPAHASMFTGLYPSEHGIVAMSERRRLHPELPTLASALGRAGYRRAAFTGGANMAAEFGFDSGFEVYRSDGRRLEDNLGSALAWISAADERPFFLFLHGFDPHRPYRSEPADRRALGLPGQRTRGLKQACQSGRAPDNLDRHLAEYDAAVHRGDRSLGRFLAGLDELGHGSDTVVVFTSDHGEEFFEHGRCFHIRTLYREVVEVPLVIRVPGLEPRRVPAPVPASVAVAPTVLGVVGAPRHGVAGPSLVDALMGKGWDGRFVVSETSSRLAKGRDSGHVRAATRADDKIVRWLSAQRSEYFDLSTDRAENRALEPGRRGRALESALDAWVEQHGPRLEAPAHGPLPDRLARKLRALGYVD